MSRSTLNFSQSLYLPSGATLLLLLQGCVGLNETAVSAEGRDPASSGPNVDTIVTGATTGGGSCSVTPGTASESTVLAGVTFPTSSGSLSTGTMPNLGIVDVTSALPSAGYVTGFTGLTTANVCSDVQLFGNSGAATCVTGTATAAVTDVLASKTFWNAAGANVTGTMVDRGTWTLTGSSSSFPGAGYYSAVGSAPTAADICSGTTIAGVPGSSTCTSISGSTGSAASAAQICSGYYAPGSSAAINGTRTCALTTAPSTISGLKVWLDAQYPHDLTTTLTDGAYMSMWYDLSGSSNHAFGNFNTATTRPRWYGTAGPNSKPIVRFNGSSSGLVIPQLTLATFESFIVVKGGGTTLMEFAHGYGSNWILLGLYSVFVNKAGTAIAKNASNPAAAAFTLIRHEFGGTGTDADMKRYHNGTASALSNCTSGCGAYGGNPGTGSMTDDVFIGTRNFAGNYLSADIAEWILYNRALDSAEITTVECYLAAKYAITVAGC